jgi:hemolysin activation/secretion protein
MPWGGFLNVFGSYAELVPDLGNSFGQEGHSLQLSGRYSRDLPALGSLSEQIQIGFDFKRTNNNLAFGGTQVFQNSTDIEQFLLIYDATIPDSLGQTAFENQVVGSPGGFSLADSTARYLASGVAGSNASYVYDNLQVTRLTYVPGKFTVFARAEGQIASSELLPSEQLGAGGVDTVRGYDLRAANGSQGVLASVELRSPTFSLLKTAWSNAPDTTQVLAFFDYGDVSYKDKQQGLPKSATLDSVGLGVRYTLSRHLDASFDYGWQLAKAPNETTLGSMATVSVSLSY